VAHVAGRRVGAHRGGEPVAAARELLGEVEHLPARFVGLLCDTLVMTGDQLAGNGQ
jgi:hypothetical protein